MIATVLFAAAAAAASAPPATPCSGANVVQAGAAPAQFKRLDQLPRAQLHLAVMRQLGGCYVTTVVAGRTIHYVPLPGSDSAVGRKTQARTPQNP